MCERECIHYTWSTSIGSFSWLNLLTAVVTPRNYTCNTATVVQTITQLRNRSQFRCSAAGVTFCLILYIDVSLCMHRSTLCIQTIKTLNLGSSQSNTVQKHTPGSCSLFICCFPSGRLRHTARRGTLAAEIFASVSRFLVAERPGCLRQHECVGRGLETNASPRVLCLRGRVWRSQRDCRG